ncbi:MAG: substrate-binding domain-containing protein [Spirochaetota bacterium]
MDVNDANGSIEELRKKFLTGKISRREFLRKLGKFGLAAPVSLYVARMSGIFGIDKALAGGKKEEAKKAETPRELSETIEEAMSLKMLEPVELRDNSEFKTKPPWRVGFANPGVNNPWRVCFQACIEYQKSLTPEIGEFYQTDAREKAEKQISDIEDLMTKDLDAIMVNPVTSQALKPIMEEIYKTGTPSVTVDRWVNTDKVTCRTSSEHQDKVGTAVGEYFGKQLKGKGKIIWLKAIEGVPEHDRRNNSFHDVITSKYPDIELIGPVLVGDLQASSHKRVASDMISKHPDLDAIFDDISFNAPHILDIFLERGMDIPVMNGEDINGWLKMWKKYDVSSIAGSFPVYCGRTGVKAVELILKGERTPKVWWIPVLVIREEERSKYIRPQFPDSFFATTEVPEKWLVEEYDIMTKLT